MMIKENPDCACRSQNIGLLYMLPTIAEWFDSLYQVARELLQKRQHGIAAKYAK
jgi:hypothetical protein